MQSPSLCQFIDVTVIFDTFFRCIMDSSSSLFKYPLVTDMIAFFQPFLIIALVSECVLFIWLLIIGERIWTSCHVTSVCKI